MIIAGAGGHGLEVRAALISAGMDQSEIFFFDQNPLLKNTHSYSDQLLLDSSELQSKLAIESKFVLGVGKPEARSRLFFHLKKLGGTHVGVRGAFAVNQTEASGEFDLMSYGFVGPDTKIGCGVLVNTRASIHHECKVGDFCEIGPGAILLGACVLGEKCIIGAGAIILPGVQLGDEIVVGAGAVVTKNISTKGIYRGIPAR